LGDVSKRAAREGLAAGVLAAELKEKAEARATEDKAAAAAREKRRRRRKKPEKPSSETTELQE
jgi:sRNA-binding protein